jgi:phage recombination protein Bet
MADQTDAAPEPEAPQPKQPMAVVTRLARDTTDITSPARYGWEPDQIAAIKHTVAADCTPAEFVMFLELAARYKLDPFAKQIWAAKMGSKGVAIIVGRDGYLTIAERHPAYEGIDGDVVRVGDKFRVVRGAKGPEVEHEYAAAEERGPILGAWAMVWRSDRRVPMYFWAPVGDYKPTSASKLQYSPWGTQESVMMLKCAQSTVLRLMFNISGFVPEEEASVQLARGEQNNLSAGDAAVIEWGDDPLLAQWLQDLLTRANEAKPNAYRERKVQTLLRGRTDDERRIFAQEVVQFLMSRSAGVPVPPEDLAMLNDHGEVFWVPTVDGQAVEVEGDVAVEEVG